MMKKRSMSTVESITSEFQQKFKDKINFVTKQGIVCSLFESGQLKRPSKPANSSRKMQESTKSIQKNQQKPFMQREQRTFSLPKLKRSLSNYNEANSRTAKLQRTNFNVFLLGLSGNAGNVKLQRNESRNLK